MRIRTVQKVMINHLIIVVILLSDWCSAIKTSNVDTNNLADVTSRQLSSYPQQTSFFPRDEDNNNKEYGSNKFNSYENQEELERQKYSALYSKYAPILEYNSNQQPPYNGSPKPDNFRFSDHHRPVDNNNEYDSSTFNRYESERQEDRQQYPPQYSQNVPNTDYIPNRQPQYTGGANYANFQFSNDQRPDNVDPEYNNNNFNNYVSQEQDVRPQYSPPYAPQYPQNEIILDYNPNIQQQQYPQDPNQQNFPFAKDPNQENYFYNKNGVIPQRQESYYANQNAVIPLPGRPQMYYRPQAQQQVNSNYYDKYRRIPPVNNNYYNQNNVNYAGQYNNYYNGPPNRPPYRQTGNYPNQFNGRPFGANTGKRQQNPYQSKSPKVGNSGNKLIKVIEDISKNDDYQCVPKLICQTLGDPANVPSFLNGQTLATVMMILPQDSPYYNFGHAAVQGINAGPSSCHNAYPKCPRNEEDILYYLNNHRGGFFRLFNRGLAFGDDSASIYHKPEYANDQGNPIIQHQNPDLKPGEQTSLASLAIVQNLLNSVTKNGLDFNTLGSLASLLGTQNKNNGDKYSQSAGGNGIGGYVSNLLGGVIGKFTGRSKRSLKYDDDNENHKKITEGINRKRNLDLELINPYESFESKKIKSPNSESRVIQKLLNSNENSIENVPHLAPEAERRILNINEPQIPVVFENSNKIESQNPFFPKEQQFIFQFVETNRIPKKFPFQLPTTTTTHGENAVSYQSILRFPNENSVSNEHQFQIIPQPLDYYDRTQMIFPDRTGTGNLRFDNDAFHSTRFGKILNRQPPTSTYSPINQNNYNQYYDQISYPSASSSHTSSTSSTSSSSRPNYYSYSSVTRDPTPSPITDNNVYVTNGQGVVEYYVNERGQKIYT